MSNAQPFKSGYQIVVDAINENIIESGYQLTRDNLSFGVPVVDPENPASVAVELTRGNIHQISAPGMPPRILTGSVTVTYDRVELWDAFAKIDIGSPSVSGYFETSGDIVAALNAKYGIELTSVDIDMNVPVPEDATTFWLEAGQSYGYIDGVTVNIDIEELPLDELITNTDLNPLVPGIPTEL